MIKVKSIALLWNNVHICILLLRKRNYPHRVFGSIFLKWCWCALLCSDSTVQGIKVLSSQAQPHQAQAPRRRYLRLKEQKPSSHSHGGLPAGPTGIRDIKQDRGQPDILPTSPIRSTWSPRCNKPDVIHTLLCLFPLVFLCKLSPLFAEKHWHGCANSRKIIPASCTSFANQAQSNQVGETICLNIFLKKEWNGEKRKRRCSPALSPGQWHLPHSLNDGLSGP